MLTGNIVKLNIGGTVFQTSKSTLTKFDGFFKTMLETDVPVEKDETGAIFIDRDSKHFRTILNFMRDGIVELPDCVTKLMEIRKEAMYYLLDGLVKLCNSKIPFLKRFKSSYDKGADQIVDALVNSSKKAILLVPYNPDLDAKGATQFSLIVGKYKNEIDIFTVTLSRFGYIDYYWLVDKETKKKEEVNEIQLEQIMKERYGIGN